MYFGLYWYLFCKYWHILISNTCLPKIPDTHSGMYQFVLVCIGKDVFRFFVTFQFSAMLHCKPHLVHGVLFLQLQLSPDLIIWTYKYVPMYKYYVSYVQVLHIQTPSQSTSAKTLFLCALFKNHFVSMVMVVSKYTPSLNSISTWFSRLDLDFVLYFGVLGGKWKSKKPWTSYGIEHNFIWSLDHPIAQ